MHDILDCKNISFDFENLRNEKSFRNTPDFAKYNTDVPLNDIMNDDYGTYGIRCINNDSLRSSKID